MRHWGLPMLLGSLIVAIVLSSAVWLAPGAKAYSSLVPLGSDELRFEVVNGVEVQLSYRLPRGQTWRAVYDRFTNQGWVMRDAELLIWPELMDDTHAAAVFLRFGWQPLGRQKLLIHRDVVDPQRFVVEMTRCAPIALLASCD